MPQISVIIPTFNRSGCIANAIVSVLQQEMVDLELIVVDDCSTDDTELVVRKFEDNRLIYSKLDKNRGGSYAMNHGVKLASGSWLSFLDSDDRFLPQKLFDQLIAIRESSGETSIRAIGTRAVLIGVDGKTLDVRPRKDVEFLKGASVADSLTGTPIQLSTWLIERKLFDEVGGFDEQIKKTKDRDFLIRLLRVAPMHMLSRVSVEMVDTLGSITRARYPDSELRTLEKNDDSYALLEAEALSKMYLNIAIDYLISNDIKRFKYCCDKARQACPSTWNVFNDLVYTGLSSLTNALAYCYLVFRKLKL